MLSNQLWLTAPPTGGAFLFLNPQAAEVFSFFYDLRPKTASFFFFHKLQKSKVVSVLFSFFFDLRPETSPSPFVHFFSYQPLTSNMSFSYQSTSPQNPNNILKFYKSPTKSFWSILGSVKYYSMVKKKLQ